jgi:cytidine deaminase
VDPTTSTHTLSPAEATALMARAREARRHAYAPYSRFPVGAALLCDDGTVFTGCNVENAAFGLTNCAERVALQKAVSEGRHSGFRAVAVVGPRDEAPCTPCGSCRQVLFEFGPEMLILTPDGEGDLPRSTPARDLLPDGFGPQDLAAGAGAGGGG